MCNEFGNIITYFETKYGMQKTMRCLPSSELRGLLVGENRSLRISIMILSIYCDVIYIL